ncbi:MAG TPA: sugar transferase [Aggregatilineales bacterium]|nr:sugar transferase [Anaerolineales bacterium]HRE47052.1 sugar transferase [Aggregatilineales bacterium]
MSDRPPEKSEKEAARATHPSGIQFQPRLRNQLNISERRLLLMGGDTAAIFIAITISLIIWSFVGKEGFHTEFLLPKLYWYVILPTLWFFLARANDFYDLRLAAQRGRSLTRLMIIEAQLFIAYLIIFFLAARTALPRLFILYYAVLSFLLIAAWRVWRPFLIGFTASRRRALIVGTGRGAALISETLRQEAANDYEIVGMVESIEKPDVGESIIGTGRDIPFIVRLKNISELIIAYEETLPADIFQGVMACYEAGVTIIPMPLLYEQITGRVPIEHVGQVHWTVVLPLQGRGATFNMYLTLKRLLDIVLALFGLAVFALIFIPLVVIMQIDSRGAIFYRQERVGRGGRLFKVIKLRSMIPDAEKYSGPQWASANDPRITRVGRILRKTRLDEIPQLVNVLRGEMSIVGPRPERPHFVETLSKDIPFYRTRLLVQPGLTGWAQVRYRYGNTREDALIKLQYDLYYIRHRSITLDLLIMLRTVGKVLSLSGT